MWLIKSSESLPLINKQFLKNSDKTWWRGGYFIEMNNTRFLLYFKAISGDQIMIIYILICEGEMGFGHDGEFFEF